MPPWPHDECIEDVRVPLLHTPVDLQGSIKIFGIEPPPYRHHGRSHLVQVGKDVSGLPEIVIVGVD